MTNPKGEKKKERAPTIDLPVYRTPFKPGNQLWRLRKSHGRNPIYDDPEKLAQACEQYFEYMTNNPLERVEARAVGGALVAAEEPVTRPFTITGLCLYIGVAERTWRSWKSPKDNYYREDLLPVVMWAEDVCRQQSLELAAIGAIKENIIAQYLGLRAKIDHSSEDGTMAPPGRIEIVPVKPRFLEDDK